MGFWAKPAVAVMATLVALTQPADAQRRDGPVDSADVDAVLLSDLREGDAARERLAWSSLCQVLFNTNAFITVD